MIQVVFGFIIGAYCGTYYNAKPYFDKFFEELNKIKK